jgi:hypothetical protein
MEDRTTSGVAWATAAVGTVTGAFEAGAKAIIDFLEGDDGVDSSGATTSSGAAPAGVERDLNNNPTGHPLGTPKNLPSPNASEQEIQEALGPDWVHTNPPHGNWYNKKTGERLRPDTTHGGDPHWDYGYDRGQHPDATIADNKNAYGNDKGWRIFPDGRVEPKK